MLVLMIAFGQNPFHCLHELLFLLINSKLLIFNKLINLVQTSTVKRVESSFLQFWWNSMALIIAMLILEISLIGKGFFNNLGSQSLTSVVLVGLLHLLSAGLSSLHPPGVLIWP